MRPGFDACGFASIEDLQSAQWLETFQELEISQNEFLAKEAFFRSPDYEWPKDPLHTWSRLWEYPYVWHHATAWLQAAGSSTANLADVGSGVTFFPFALARAGYSVLAIDNDPITETDLLAARSAVQVDPERLSFLLGDARQIPLDDETLDAAVCVSVMEHIPSPASVVPELARVLRPGGLLVLTMDIDLAGGSELGVAAFRAVLDALDEHFAPRVPARSVHPLALLTTRSSPIAWPRAPLRERVMRAARSPATYAGRAVRRVAARVSGTPSPGVPHLTVYGYVGTRQ